MHPQLLLWRAALGHDECDLANATVDNAALAEALSAACRNAEMAKALVVPSGRTALVEVAADNPLSVEKRRSRRRRAA